MHIYHHYDWSKVPRNVLHFLQPDAKAISFGTRLFTSLSFSSVEKYEKNHTNTSSNNQKAIQNEFGVSSMKIEQRR